MFKNLCLTLITFCLAIVLNSCTRLIIDEYEAVATTSLTWRVEYYIGSNDRPSRSRWEEFSSASLENINGERPPDAFGDADNQGLWWPRIPPKPTIDEVEDLQKTGERHSPPEMLRQVDYTISYRQGSSYVTLPTHYPVYRQAVRAAQSGQALKLTLRADERFVEKAEAI
ncbi:MAG: hypothetical protein EA365_08040 [Gloeocapsa sp. DLM2.Bin57]|nr:MAG: hypothetical protein EA365_08040 [Gloeocapsa sp. DLM2.Bin57]